MGATGVKAGQTGFSSYNIYHHSQTSTSETFDLKMQGPINGRRESYASAKHISPSDSSGIIHIPHIYRRMSAVSSPTATDSLTPLGLAPVVASLSAEAQLTDHIKTSLICPGVISTSTTRTPILNHHEILLKEKLEKEVWQPDHSPQNFIRSISQSSKSEEDPLFKELETSEVFEEKDQALDSTVGYDESDSLRRDTITHGNVEDQPPPTFVASHMMSSESSCRPILGITVDTNMNNRGHIQSIGETEASNHLITPSECGTATATDTCCSPMAHNLCQELALPPKYPAILTHEKFQQKGSSIKLPKFQSNNTAVHQSAHQTEDTSPASDQRKLVVADNRTVKAIEIIDPINLSSERKVTSDPLLRTRSRRGSQLFTAVATGLRNLLGGESGETSSPNKSSQQLAITGRNSNNNDPTRRHSIANHSPASDDKSGAVAQLVDYLEARRRYKEVAIKLAMSGSTGNMDDDKIDLASTTDGSPQPPKAPPPPEVTHALFIPKPEAARPLSMVTNTPTSPAVTNPSSAFRMHNNFRHNMVSRSGSKGMVQQMNTGTDPPVRHSMSDSGSQTYTRLLIDACTQTEVTRVEKIHRTTQADDRILPAKMT